VTAGSEGQSEAALVPSPPHGDQCAELPEDFSMRQVCMEQQNAAARRYWRHEQSAEHLRYVAKATLPGARWMLPALNAQT